MLAIRRVLSVLGLLLTLALACNLPINKVSGPDATITAAVRTIKAQLTGTAQVLSETPGTETPEPSATVRPTRTPGRLTQTSSGPTPLTRCNSAQFVGDLSIPDGTQLATNAPFTKVWRLKNIGTCTWSTDYTVVFDSGTAMGARASVPMPGVVRPGDSVDVSIPMTAPPVAGRYTGYWKLENAAGIPFGVGSDSQGTFYVQIEVISLTRTIIPSMTPTPTSLPGQALVYDFTTNYCDAAWRSGAGTLPCPGANQDQNGSVIRVDKPTLQDGATRNLPGLWTHPQWVAGGVISGTYPSFFVEAGDHFRAVLGCINQALQCNVRFQLNYRADNGDLKNFGQWDMSYENSPRTLDLDLTSLKGLNVVFVLTVIANGSPEQDWAFWWQPRITR